MKTTHIGRRSPSARFRPSRWLWSGPWWGRMYRGDCSHATEPRRSTTCDCPPIVQIDMTPYRNSPVVSTSHGIYLRTKLYTYTIHTPDGHPIHPDTCPRFVLYTGAEGIGGLISLLYKCVLHAVHAWQPSTAPLQTGLFDWMFKLHLCLPSNKHTVFNLVLVPCSLVVHNELWQKRKCAFRETIKYHDFTS